MNDDELRQRYLNTCLAIGEYVVAKDLSDIEIPRLLKQAADMLAEIRKKESAKRVPEKSENVNAQCAKGDS